MDFAPDARTTELVERLDAFMAEHVLPAEPVFAEQAATLTDPWDRPPVLAELAAEARGRGLWNLFLPDLPDGRRLGAGLTTLQYAPLAEITGRSPHLAPEALNCSAPDTGNMELLAHAGTPAQQERWLDPLLRGETRSAFCMTEPDVASSDATNIRTRIRRDGEEYVVDGRKWWSTGALSPRCTLLVVMGRTSAGDDGHQGDADHHEVVDHRGATGSAGGAAGADAHRQHSMLLVPRDAPGVRVERGLRVFGYDDGPHGGHAEVVFDGVRVPASHLLGREGDGFAIAQARLGPGRVHHCMRLLGMGERALELLCRRAVSRTAFGRRLADHGTTRDRIAEARVRLEQARLLVLKTAWLVDTVGARAARTEIQAIKVVVPSLVQDVVDWAIQVHGGAGVSQDTVLPQLWVQARTLRLADGPDEVHRASIARRELSRYL